MIKNKKMNNNRLLNIALYLAIITILYNIVEGVVSVVFGYEDETLILFGFGVDSFVEVISGIGVLHMVIRMKTSQVDKHDNFEKTALKITGTAFYILSIGLVIGSILNIVFNIKPSTTLVGIIISSISIVTMYLLLKYKLKIGNTLNSQAIIADANCTKTCFYLSFILLLASVLYEVFGVFYIDIIGSLAIAFFAFKEGKEAFEKVKVGKIACSGGCE